MLTGELTLLRARVPEDVPVLHADLHDDVATRVRASTRPWVPVPNGPDSPYAMPSGPPYTDSAVFSVAELATGELAGEALLWDIDTHNRSAHIGIALRASARGRGLGLDAVRVLCRYGFAIRGLHRLQLETLSDNHAMIAVAGKLGFTREGMTRCSYWVNGGFADDVIFGLLTAEFAG